MDSGQVSRGEPGSRNWFVTIALWEDLGKQADIILYHPASSSAPSSVTSFMSPASSSSLFLSLSLSLRKSLQLAVVIVLLLIRIRLISLLELGASGPSPLLGELPPSLLFITICSLSCVILIVKLKRRMFCVFCASLRQRTSSSQQPISVSAQLEGRRRSRDSALLSRALLHSKVVNLSLGNTVCFTSSCSRNSAAVSLFWDLLCPLRLLCDPKTGRNFPLGQKYSQIG